MQAEQRFSTENMPAWFDEEAKTFRKTALTRAARVPGPFVVETSEGPLRCEDGYLAVDARGYPYPIAADEFEQIYEEAAASQVVAGSTPVDSPNWLRDAALNHAVKFAEGRGLGDSADEVVKTAEKFYGFLSPKEAADA